MAKRYLSRISKQSEHAVFHLEENFHTGSNNAPSKHAGKNTFSGHDTIAGLIIDSAASVAFFADLDN